MLHASNSSSQGNSRMKTYEGINRSEGLLLTNHRVRSRAAGPAQFYETATACSTPGLFSSFRRTIEMQRKNLQRWNNFSQLRQLSLIYYQKMISARKAMYIPIILYIQVSKTWGTKIRFKEIVSSLKRKERKKR